MFFIIDDYNFYIQTTKVWGACPFLRQGMAREKYFEKENLEG